MRPVSGENGRRRKPPASGAPALARSWPQRRNGRPSRPSVRSAAGDERPCDAVSGSALPISIADAIEGFYLGEVAIDSLELLVQPLDVAVDRSIVDVVVLAIGRVHQLIT